MIIENQQDVTAATQALLSGDASRVGSRAKD